MKLTSIMNSSSYSAMAMIIDEIKRPCAPYFLEKVIGISSIKSKKTGKFYEFFFPQDRP